VGSSAGSTPAGAALLSAFFALVVLRFIAVKLAVPSATDLFAKEGGFMKKVKLMLASAVDTCHGLGVSSLAGCLLTKVS
jgi:hypothetical protein